MTEARAIELCIVHHDPIGFEHLFRTYRREALYHARNLLGNDQDAADACQECFCKAYNAMARLKSLDQFYPWFYRILRNHCLNVLSRRKRDSSYRDALFNAGNERSRPDFVITENEKQRLTWDVLESLPPEQREILSLKYLQAKSYEEIACLLGIPRGTVMSRLYHARLGYRKEFLNREQEEGAVER